MLGQYPFNYIHGPLMVGIYTNHQRYVNPLMKNSITKINARLKASSTHTYTKYQLRRFFDGHRSNGEIPSNLSFASFVGEILKHEYLELVSIEPLRLPKEKGKPPYRTY